MKGNCCYCGLRTTLGDHLRSMTRLHCKECCMKDAMAIATWRPFKRISKRKAKQPAAGKAVVVVDPQKGGRER